MSAEARLFDAWCVPAWGRAGPELATRVLPPARVREVGSPDVALAVPELGPAHVAELARSLRAARGELMDRPALEVGRAIGRVGERFLAPGDPLREEALRVLPATTGLSPAMCREVLDGMARDWTGERLERLLRTDFPDPACLDRFVPAPGRASGGRMLRAVGSGLAFHLSSGSVPGVSATSLARSLLVKAPVLLKPGRGDVALPVLMLRGLAEEDPELAGAAAVIYWAGGEDASTTLEDAALEAAELVVVYGGEAVVRSVRSRLAASTRLVAYHHRLGFGVVGREVPGEEMDAVASDAARAVATFDQRGCVSPHVLFVEEAAAPDAFVDALAAALDRLDRELPPGPLDDAEASAVQQLRGSVEMRRAAGQGLRLRSGEGARWTVVVDADGRLEPSCAPRVVRVVPVADASDVPRRVEHLSAHLQTAGVAGIGGARLRSLAEALARVGVLRVVPFAEAAFPPAWWRHDGRGPLEVLIRWVEMSGDAGEG